MTNKKFKLAAMSMALTACVAAQPLVANAADDIDAAGAQDNAPAPQEISGTGVASASTTEETKEDVRNNEPTDAVDVIDDDTTVDYNHDNDTTTKNDDGSTTTDSTGPVNKNEASSEDEQQPEKTPIGAAEKSETETKETETVLDRDTTRPSGAFHFCREPGRHHYDHHPHHHRGHRDHDYHGERRSQGRHRGTHQHSFGKD